MQRLITLFLLSTILAVALAGGQYYVPRAYYTIDAAGHESAPVPLLRLRRSFYPGADANANANANAEAYGGGSASASANANAYANARGGPGGFVGMPGGWGTPGMYGASEPLSAGMTRRMYGAVQGGRSVSASSSIGIDGLGNGAYDMSTSVGN